MAETWPSYPKAEPLGMLGRCSKTQAVRSTCSSPIRLFLRNQDAPLLATPFRCNSGSRPSNATKVLQEKALMYKMLITNVLRRTACALLRR
jgi:hypothetical protein